MAAEAIAERGSAAAIHPSDLVIAGHVARRLARGAAIWGAVLGVMTLSIVNEFSSEYPTAADRARLVKTMGADAGTRAIFGPAHHLDTVAGYEAYHVIAIAAVAGAIWGLLAGTRLLRGEEEAGSWELLLAGQTTRRRATAAALAGLGTGVLVFWAVAAAGVAVLGRTADPPFPVGASLFTALAAVASAAIFLAVGALSSQLAATRRQAAGLAAALFGVFYLLRVVAYSGTSLRWLHWVTPLGWVDELRPLTGSRPLAFLPILATIAALVAVTLVLAGRRDLGAGVIPANDTAAPRTRFLNGSLGLAYRLELRTALGWLVGIGIGGLVMGLSTKSAESIWKGSSSGIIQRLGGANGSAAYLGMLFLLVVLLVTMAAAAQVAATREEEAEGRLDHLLARPVARVPWLAGRVAVSAATLVVAGILAGLAIWVSAASAGADVSFPKLLAAGVNVVPAGIFVLGIGTLAHALIPRFASALAYGLVAWSFLVEIVGAGLGLSPWLLDLSVAHHIARAPAADPRWGMAAVLVALGVAAAALGSLAFARRDLAGA